MIVKPKNVRKFQEGGPVAMEDPAMVQDAAMAEQAPAGGEDPIMQIAQIFMQALQAQDCNLCMQGAQMFLQLIEQAQGGGGAPAPEGEPVYRKGGKLAYRIRK